MFPGSSRFCVCNLNNYLKKKKKNPAQRVTLQHSLFCEKKSRHLVLQHFYFAQLLNFYREIYTLLFVGI